MADLLKENDDSKDDDIVIVEDDPNAQQQEQTGIEDEEDVRVKSSNDDEDDDEPIEGNDKEREAIRERRRLEKQERKVRREEAIKRDKLELDFLRKRNDDLERRVTTQEQRAYQADLRGFDAEIARAQQEAEMAEKVIAKAVEAGNGDDVAQALKYRDAAVQRAQQLAWHKQQAAQQPIFQQQQLDDVTLNYAKQFLNDNKWYDPQGRDEDSAIVLAIDQAMGRDGFNPQSPDYWDELRKRAARRLPERFASNEEKTTQRREARGGPTVGSGKEHAPTSTRKEIYVSPERKQALIDAGVWDDPILRSKYVKRYAEYDRQNKA
jgi:hypothetical protein